MVNHALDNQWRHNFNTLLANQSFDFVTPLDENQSRPIRNFKGCKLTPEDLLCIFDACAKGCKNVNKNYANLPEPTDREIARFVKAPRKNKQQNQKKTPRSLK